MLLNSEQTYIYACVLSLNVVIVLVSCWLGSIYIMIAWKRVQGQVKASTKSEDLKSWSSFSLLLFCFCMRGGLCRFSSHPRSPEIRTCFHFFLLLDVIDHPKREKGTVDVQCSSWATLESSVLCERCILLRGLPVWLGFGFFLGLQPLAYGAFMMI